MKTLEEIRTILNSRSSDLRREYAITRLAVFGSVVRGEAGPDSDVDILATFAQPVGLLKLISAEYYLSDLLESRVDLVPSDDIRPELREPIRREAVEI